MVSKNPYLLLKFGSVTIWLRNRLYLCSFKGTSKCFIVKFSHIMLLHQVLQWKRVLVSCGYILKTTIARHSSVTPFDSK